MKKFFSFFLTLALSVSAFAATEIEIVLESLPTKWYYMNDQNDLFWQHKNAKDQNGDSWNFGIDPIIDAVNGEYPWGSIIEQKDIDISSSEFKKGYTSVTNIANLKVCATKEDSEIKYELVFDGTFSNADYHFHVSYNLPEGTTLFESGDSGEGDDNGDGNDQELVADFDIEATGWKNETRGGDVYFQIYGPGTWTFQFDPDESTFDTWTWGETYTKDNFDYGYASVSGPENDANGKAQEFISFTMTLDGSNNIAYLDAWILSKNGKYIHLHYGEAPAEKEDGEIELVSSDMKDATADGTDVYIGMFTANDTKGRTWSFSFDPKVTSAEKHYPWGTTMSLSDLDDDPRYTYVKLDGEALTLSSLSLFMDLSEDNGKPYLDATIEGSLGAQEYHIHVTANKPAPATEIIATSLTSQVLYNGKAQLSFTAPNNTTVTVEFAESTVYFDQVYNYTSKQDSITAISTKYNGGSLEGMNYKAGYSCKANFLATKGEGNDITIALSYTTAYDNKYKLSYTGAYTGSVIGYPIVEPDTIDIALPKAQAGETEVLGATYKVVTAASEDEKYTLDIVLTVGSLLGEEGAPGKFTEADLADGSTAMLNGQAATIATADITISKGANGGLILEAYITSESVENTVFHFTSAPFGYLYNYSALMIQVDVEEKKISATSDGVEAIFLIGGETLLGTTSSLLEGSSINGEAITEAELTIVYSEENGIWMVNGYVITAEYNTYYLSLTSALPEPAKIITITDNDADWLIDEETGAWMLNYAMEEGEELAVGGTLIFADEEKNFERSYSSEELLTSSPEVMYFDLENPDGISLKVLQAKDIAITANEEKTIASLSGTLLAINAQGIIFQFDLEISGEYPGEEEGPATAIDAVNSNAAATKILRRGALIIRQGETEYNVLGARL